MTPEQQRIAIAEACGINPHPNNDARPLKDKCWSRQYGGGKGPCYTFFGEAQDDVGWGGIKPLPDYLSDLNAMHEAEKALQDPAGNTFCSTWWNYRSNLIDICDRDLGDQGAEHLNATAAQRAEAFLRTLNLWKP